MKDEQQMSGSIKEMSPLDSSDRLNHIDSLRGFALFGILMVNMLAFQYGTIGFKFIYPGLTSPDQSAHVFIEWFFQGSFYPVFSILFGFGAVMIWDRASEKQRPFNLMFIRRLLLLMAIGFIHLYFIWDGDILLAYSITGLVFFLFIKRAAKTLLVWALLLAGFMALPGLFPGDDGAVPPGLKEFGVSEQEILAEGSYADVVTHRFTSNPYEAIDYGPGVAPEEQELLASAMSVINFITITVQTLFLFLLGGFIAKKRWLHRPQQNSGILLKASVAGVTAGLILKGAMVFTDNASLDYLGYIIGGPILGVGYIALFTLVFVKTGAASIFHGLAYTGQMALTNYLLQSVVMTTIFYGYGFGLFASIGTLAGILLAVAFFAVQMLLSKWWLGRFRFGPVEWIWRSGTYLRKQPIKK